MIVSLDPNLGLPIRSHGLLFGGIYQKPTLKFGQCADANVA